MPTVSSFTTTDFSLIPDYLDRIERGFEDDERTPPLAAQRYFLAALIVLCQERFQKSEYEHIEVIRAQLTSPTPTHLEKAWQGLMALADRLGFNHKSIRAVSQTTITEDKDIREAGRAITQIIASLRLQDFLNRQTHRASQRFAETAHGMRLMASLNPADAGRLQHILSGSATDSRLILSASQFVDLVGVLSDLTLDLQRNGARFALETFRRIEKEPTPESLNALATLVEVELLRDPTAAMSALLSVNTMQNEDLWRCRENAMTRATDAILSKGEDAHQLVWAQKLVQFLSSLTSTGHTARLTGRIEGVAQFVSNLLQRTVNDLSPENAKTLAVRIRPVPIPTEPGPLVNAHILRAFDNNPHVLADPQCATNLSTFIPLALRSNYPDLRAMAVTRLDGLYPLLGIPHRASLLATLMTDNELKAADIELMVSRSSRNIPQDLLQMTELIEVKSDSDCLNALTVLAGTLHENDDPRFEPVRVAALGRMNRALRSEEYPSAQRYEGLIDHFPEIGGSFATDEIQETLEQLAGRLCKWALHQNFARRSDEEDLHRVLRKVLRYLSPARFHRLVQTRSSGTRSAEVMVVYAEALKQREDRGEMGETIQFVAQSLARSYGVQTSSWISLFVAAPVSLRPQLLRDAAEKISNSGFNFLTKFAEWDESRSLRTAIDEIPFATRREIHASLPPGNGLTVLFAASLVAEAGPTMNGDIIDGLGDPAPVLALVGDRVGAAHANRFLEAIYERSSLASRGRDAATVTTLQRQQVDQQVEVAKKLAASLTQAEIAVWHERMIQDGKKFRLPVPVLGFEAVGVALYPRFSEGQRAAFRRLALRRTDLKSLEPVLRDSVSDTEWQQTLHVIADDPPHDTVETVESLRLMLRMPPIREDAPLMTKMARVFFAPAVLKATAVMMEPAQFTNAFNLLIQYADAPQRADSVVALRAALSDLKTGAALMRLQPLLESLVGISEPTNDAETLKLLGTLVDGKYGDADPLEIINPILARQSATFACHAIFDCDPPSTLLTRALEEHAAAATPAYRSELLQWVRGHIPPGDTKALGVLAKIMPLLDGEEQRMAYALITFVAYSGNLKDDRKRARLSLRFSRVREESVFGRKTQPSDLAEVVPPQETQRSWDETLVFIDQSLRDIHNTYLSGEARVSLGMTYIHFSPEERKRLLAHTERELNRRKAVHLVNRHLRGIALLCPYLEEEEQKRALLLLHAHNRGATINASIQKHAATLLDHISDDFGITAKSLLGRMPDETDFATLDTKPFNHMSPEEMQEFIRANNLAKILETFGDDPVSLIQALEILHHNTFADRDISEFVKRYEGLNVGTTQKPAQPQSPSELRAAYFDSLIAALSRGNLDTSQTGLRNALDLLIAMSRTSFEESPDALITELEDIARRQSNEGIAAIYQNAAAHFRSIIDFNVQGMRTRPYGYHKEGIHFLASRNAALLTDEAGMGKTYQAIGAIETLEHGRTTPSVTLYITPAEIKSTVAEEITEHTNIAPEKVLTLTSGDPRARAEEINTIQGKRYVITNYENLVALRANDPASFAKLATAIDNIIVDEAQMMDNPRTERTKAIQAITEIADAHHGTPIRRILLSASPYQTNPETMFTLFRFLDPQNPNFRDYTVFRQRYCTTTTGLKLMRADTRHLMLRRTRQKTLTKFRPPEEIPFAEQLKDGIPRIPDFRRIPPEEAGLFEITAEQADIYTAMIADFGRFVDAYNADLEDPSQFIDPTTLNPLLKLTMLQRVLYMPELFGLEIADDENPLYQTLDQRVEQRLARGEKVILWAYNRSVINRIVNRYRARYGDQSVVQIDGGIKGEHRTEARHRFQQDPACRLLVANYEAGGQGLTMTAAHADIFVQLPNRYTLLYQAEGRKQRLIGLLNILYAKAWVESEYLVPRLPADFIARITDQGLKSLLERGSIIEQTFARLNGGELLFLLALEGHGRMDDLEDYFKSSLIQSLGLGSARKADYAAGFSASRQRDAAIAGALVPIHHLLPEVGSASREKANVYHLGRLAHGLRALPLSVAKDLGHAFARAGRVDPHDLDLITSFLDIKNKYIRTQIFHALPGLITRAYGNGTTLVESMARGDPGKLTATRFIAEAFLATTGGGDVLGDTAREIEEGKRDPQINRRLEDQLHMGIFGGLMDETATQILRDTDGVLSALPLGDRITSIYRLGLIARVEPGLLHDLEGITGSQDLHDKLERATRQAVANFANRDVTSLDQMLSTNPHWNNRADELLALISGWREAEMEDVLDIASEAIREMIDDHFDAYRLNDEQREHGRPIEFMKSNPDFWHAFGTDHKTHFSNLTISRETIDASLISGYENLISAYEMNAHRSESDFVKRAFAAFRALDEASEREKQMIAIRGDLQTLGRLYSSKELDDGARTTLAKYGIPLTDGAPDGTTLSKTTEDLRALFAWMQIDTTVSQIRSQGDVAWNNLRQRLASKAKEMRSRGFEDFANQLDSWRFEINQRQRLSETVNLKDITVEDTADPAIIARMGALHPELVSCMNPDGNPVFTQFVAGMWGSKNMKMLIVRDAQGNVIATGRMKVKRLDNQEPVLHVESLFTRHGYSFRNEMLAHMHNKAKAIEDKARVRPQVSRNVTSTEQTGHHPWVYGTGCTTENEYVEPVFRLRRADRVSHRASIVPVPRQLPPITVKRPLALNNHTVLGGAGSSSASISNEIHPTLPHMMPAFGGTNPMLSPFPQLSMATFLRPL